MQTDTQAIEIDIKELALATQGVSLFSQEGRVTFQQLSTSGQIVGVRVAFLIAPCEAESCKFRDAAINFPLPDEAQKYECGCKAGAISIPVNLMGFETKKTFYEILAKMQQLG